MEKELAKAAKTGDVEYLLRLIEQDSLLLDRVASTAAETPLHIASMCGHLPFVQHMLTMKMEFAYETNQDGFTPLHLASANGHLHIVMELLNALDPHRLCTVQGFDDKIALHCAVVKGRTDVMEELLAAGPSDCVEMKTARGETVFHLAVNNTQIGAFKLLVEHIKKLQKEQILNEKDEQGNTVLHLATWRKHYKVIQLMLVEDKVIKSKVEVNSRNDGGMTALDIVSMFESEAGDLEIHRALVEAGAKRGKDLPDSSSDPHPPNPTIIIDSNNIIPSAQDNNNNNNNNNNSDQLSQTVRSRYVPSDGFIAAMALVATATYQAVLSPPGGLWQDDKKDAHIAGKSILATKDLVSFLIFTVGNTVGFFFSTYSINVLVESNFITNCALFGLSFTYGTSLLRILPERNGLSGWVELLFVSVIFVGLPFIGAMFGLYPDNAPFIIAANDEFPKFQP